MARRAIRPLLQALLLALLWASELAAEEIAVIVHPDRIVSLRKAEIAQIFLKQRLFWDGGEAIVPVNRDAGSSAREDFTKTIFGSRSRAHVAYWNRAYFRGVLPPITFASDEAVLRFVASDPRAVGYVPASRVDDTVRVAARIGAKTGD